VPCQTEARRGLRFSTQEYQYRTVHCTKQSPCASVLAPRDGYLAIFSATLISACYGGCLDVGMSRYRRMRRAGRLDWILPLYGFAEHSRRSTSARGIMIRPH
jgi:hypothetical protein